MIPGTLFDWLTPSPFKVTAGPRSSSSAGLLSREVTPNGSMWLLGVGSSSKAALYEVNLTASSPTAIVRYEYPETNSSGPQFLSVSSDGAVWLAKYSSNTIERFAVGGQIESYKLPFAAGVTDIASGADGSAWFINSRGAIGLAHPGGQIEEFFPENGLVEFGWGYSGPHEIVDAAGNAWFTQWTNGSVAEMEPSGHLAAAFQIPNHSGLPAGTDGAPGPSSITIASDGTVWFTDTTDDSIGEIIDTATTKALVEYPVPPINGEVSSPLQIAVAPNGEAWFTETGPAVGSVNPNANSSTGVPATSNSTDPAPKRTVKPKRRTQNQCRKQAHHRRHSKCASRTKSHKKRAG